MAEEFVTEELGVELDETDEFAAVPRGAGGVKLAEGVLEGVELVTVAGVESAGKEGDGDKVLPSHTRMYGANSRKNESLSRFWAISL